MNIGYLVETPITKEKKLFGAQRSFVKLLAQLIPLGVKPYVVVSEEWEITDILRSLDIPCLVTPIYEFFTSVDGAYGEYHDTEVQEKRNAVSQELILDFFISNNVELIHMNTRFCGLLGAKVARLLKVPYIFHIREFLAEDFGLVFKDENLANEIISQSAALIAVSDSIHNYLSYHYPSTNIKTIYNGVDSKKYSYPKCSRFDNNIVRIAIVGRIIHHKGQFDAIRAVEFLHKNRVKNDLELNIIGFRPEEVTEYEQMLLEYVEQNDLSSIIKLIPFTDEVEKILCNCDIGLTCSKMEAFGRVTVEYMLSNLLAIGANSGGTPEILQDKVTGLLYTEGDYISLAQSIKWALSNVDAANSIISAGNDKALTKYSVEENAQSVLQVYKDIIV
jgi:glycosyltransferase involved in cell wall biosynthesis